MHSSNEHEDLLPAPVDLSPLQRTKQRKAFWAHVYARDRVAIDVAQMESWHTHRIAVAYRIVREIARLKRVIFDNEALSELLDNDEFFGWTEPICEGDFVIRSGSSYAKKVRSYNIPLLPPMSGSEHEGRRNDYFTVFTMVAERLHIIGSEEGRKGYMGMTCMETYERLWPTLAEILAYENSLLHTVLAQISADGSMVARGEIRVRYSLRRWEEDSLFAVATQGAVELLSGTVEEERAVMLLRLENYIQRCRTGEDLRAELMALKLVSDVQNLRKAKSADEASEMTDVVHTEVKRIEDEERKKAKDG